MLTHMHKVIHLVVSTFEQGSRRWWSCGSVSHWETLTRRWSCSDRTLTLASGQCWLTSHRRRWMDRMLGASGHVWSDTSGHYFSVKNPYWTRPNSRWLHPIISSGTSGRSFDFALNVLIPLKIDAWDLNKDTWRPFVSLARSDQTLGLRSVNPTSALGRPEAGALLSLTALFFGDAYK
jgi:hypothetical protein